MASGAYLSAASSLKAPSCPWYAIRIRSTILSRVLRRLRGRVGGVGEGRVWLWVGGFELEILAPEPTLAALTEGEEATLFAALLWREEGPVLVGFATMEEREAFVKLLGVGGVGPKAALALIGTLGVEGLYQAVAEGDAAALKAAPGVGKRVAERVILELKGKLPRPQTPVAEGVDPGAVAEAIEALLLLGFRESAVRRTVPALAREHPEAGPEELIRMALKELR